MGLKVSCTTNNYLYGDTYTSYYGDPGEECTDALEDAGTCDMTHYTSAALQLGKIASFGRIFAMYLFLTESQKEIKRINQMHCNLILIVEVTTF